MSVYIKDMEMPKRCGLCGWYSLHDNGCRIDMEGRILKIEDALHGRPDWCPLIEVPDHGRLIDADALEALCVKLNAENWGITRGDYKMLDAVIFEFPTIIPASGGKENE